MTVKDLPEKTRLIQLAEEASELSQASLKLVRSLSHDTPVSEAEARANLLEEIADVQVCLTAVTDSVDMMAVEAIARKKAKRWEERLNESQTT